MTHLSEKIQSIKTHFQQLEEQIKSLENGRKSSAPISRKTIMTIKQSLHEMRPEITEYVKSLPVNKRKPTTKAVEEPIEEPKPVKVKVKTAKTKKPKKPLKQPKKD